MSSKKKHKFAPITIHPKAILPNKKIIAKKAMGGFVDEETLRNQTLNPEGTGLAESANQAGLAALNMVVPGAGAIVGAAQQGSKALGQAIGGDRGEIIAENMTNPFKRIANFRRYGMDGMTGDAQLDIIRGQIDAANRHEVINDENLPMKFRGGGSLPNIMPPLRNQFQMGGDMSIPNMGMEEMDMQSPSGAALDYNEYEGNSHEEGGIPLGDKAEVEGGEVRVEDYIFSDYLRDPISNKTFAELAKKINKKYEGRGDHDAPSNRAKEKELTALMQSNELVRIQEEEREAQELAMAQEKEAMMQQGEEEIADEMVNTQQESQEMPIQEDAEMMPDNMGMESELPMFRKGGNLRKYPDGGFLQPTQVNQSFNYNKFTPSQSQLKRLQEVSKKNNWNYDFDNLLFYKGNEDFIESDDFVNYLASLGSNSNREYLNHRVADHRKRLQQNWVMDPSNNSLTKLPKEILEILNDEEVNEKKTDTTNSQNLIQNNTNRDVTVRNDYHKEWNPFTQQYEPMSPQQHRMLEKEYFKLKNQGLEPSTEGMPQFEPELLDVISRRNINNLPNATTTEESYLTELPPTFRKGGNLMGDPNFNLDSLTQDGNNINTGYAASMISPITNLAIASRAEKRRNPRIELARPDFSQYRETIKDQVALNDNIGRENIRRGSAGSSAANLAAQTANRAGAVSSSINAFREAFGTEINARNQIENQERQTNYQAALQEQEVNEQNRAMQRTVQSMAASQFGDNTQGFIRDKAARDINQDFMKLQMDLINQMYPNYEFLTSEEKAIANQNVIKALQNLQVNYKQGFHGQ